MSDFITSDDELSYDYDEFKFEEESSEDISSDASESDLDIINIFPITAHRQKYVIKLDEFEYY